MSARIASTHLISERPPKLERQTIRVVLFSGGTGTKSITEAIARHPQISLTVLINCYDDGHSTGRLRRYIPGMLGPSDVRKNIARLMPKGDRSHAALQWLSDHRLPVGINRRAARSLIESMSLQRLSGLPDEVRLRWEQLTVSQDRDLRGYLEAFLQYGEEQTTAGCEFDFTDCALGNLYFAGCYLKNGRDFNRTVDAFGRFYEIGSEVLNITLGENLFLIAQKHDGTFFLSEADLVSSPAKIRRILLVEEDAYLGRIEHAADRPVEEIRHLVETAKREPKVNPRAAAALQEADVIIYGPGTQHSSLLPSYLTEGVAERIVANREADKIFMANIRRDVDIQHDDANDLADKFLECLGRSGKTKVEWRDSVTHFFVQSAGETPSVSGYVPFDDKTFRYPLDTVVARDWEALEGRHHGGFVFDELQQIIQSRIEISLDPKPYMVSIVVPALDEIPTVEQTLKSLMALDFNEFGLSKEIILVDGGSTDGTFEAARKMRGIKALRLTGRERGRGAALRVGVEEARGNIVVFFPADNEYRAADVYPLVSQLLKNQHSAVFGARTTKVMDLSAHLKQIYKGHRVLYLTSKYGGLLISILTLVFYNRFISDALTSLKGFDAKILRSLKLESSGVELDAEIVAKLCRTQRYVLEFPVEFAPRTRAEGKKITAGDGLRVIAALLKYRFRN